MAKKAAKKSGKVLGKKDLKKTKGGLIGLFQGGVSVKNNASITDGTRGSIGNNTINGGGFIGL